MDNKVGLKCERNSGKKVDKYSANFTDLRKDKMIRKYEINQPKDFANYKDEALEIYPTIVYASTAVF